MKLYLFLLISLFFTTGVQAQAKAVKRTPVNWQYLIGQWQSADDSSYSIAFTPTTKTDYYNKEKQDEASYRIEKRYLYAIDKASRDTFTYRVVVLTKNRLQLIYLPRGNTLRFRKLP